jgi:pyridoxine 5'-phosphate synthase PdxJ
MKIVGLVILVLAGALVAYGAAIHMREDARLQAAVDTVRITDSVRSVVSETVKVKLAAKLRMDTIVRLVTDTQLVIQRERPETVTVAPEIVQRIASCDAFSSSCRLQLRADSNEIHALKHLINVTPKPSKCSRKCGFILGLSAGLLIHKAAK